MDERQAQIQTGAGLTESRLNVEFIDALKKWGPWFIILVAAAVLAYAGIGRLRAARERSQTEAFAALNDAVLAGNPAGLDRVATDQSDYPEITLQARIAAGDVLLVNVARGTRPGAQPLPADKGGDFAADDLLKPEDRGPLLAQARDQYQQALTLSETKPEWWMHTNSALFGLAAVAENEGKVDEAKQFLERAVALAKKQDLSKFAAVAQKRLDTLADTTKAPTLPAAADVHSAPKPPTPPAPPPPTEPVAPPINWDADFLMGDFMFPPTPILLEASAGAP